MRTYTLPASWDALKFATRYSLDRNSDFYVDSTGQLVVFPVLPDDPPIFELPDNALDVLRRLAVVLVDDPQQSNKLIRGVVAALLDELNNHALKINAILDAVDAATSLTDLKTSIGNIADYPQRTLVQAKDAIKTKINAGDVD